MSTANTQSDSIRLSRYLFPAVAGLLSLSLYILADTFFVARGVGSVGLAALNIAIPAYSVINATGLMIGIGSGILYSIARGCGDHEKATSTFNAALVFSLALGILFTLVGVCFATPIARALGASELSLEHSATYIRTIFAFSVFFLGNNTLNALVRNDGNPRLAMTAMVANSLANVILDYIFIIRMHLGMWGAAFATGLSPVIGLAILSLHWLKRYSSLHVEKKMPHFFLIPGIVRAGMSNFITEIGNGLIIVLFNYSLMRQSGDIGVAAYGIVANISLVISYIFIGMGQGMQPVLSTMYGQGKTQQCGSVLRTVLLLAVTTGAGFLLIGQLIPDLLAAAFNSENSAELTAITIPAIRIYFVCFPAMGLNICFTSWFQSVLRPKAASLISLLRGFLLIVVGIALLPQLLGITGVWMIIPAVEAITLVCSLVLMHLSPGKPASKAGRSGTLRSV